MKVNQLFEMLGYAFVMALNTLAGRKEVSSKLADLLFENSLKKSHVALA